VDDLSNDLFLAYALIVSQTLDSLWLMGELSAIPYLSSLQQADPRVQDQDMLSSYTLPGVPEHHYLDHNDLRF